MKLEAIVAGHVCLDVIPTLGESAAGIRPGKLVEAGPAVVSTGGVVSNTGLALHRLGVAVRLVGKVGDDLFGDAIRNIVEREGEGLADGMVVTPGEATSYSVVLSPPGQDRMFIHAPGCNDLFTAYDLEGPALHEAGLLHFGYPTLMRRMYANDGQELERVMRKAKDAGLTTSLDVSFPDADSDAGRADWRRILMRVLPYTDLFEPSAEELLFMLRPNEYARIAARGDALMELRDESIYGLAGEALDLGAKVVMVKAGSRGAYLRSRSSLEGLGRSAPPDIAAWRGARLHEPCYRIEVVGTTGAGDTTIAGFLMGWLRGFGPAEAMQAATAVGACCCERPDAVSGVRPWDETKARIDAGWPKCM